MRFTFAIFVIGSAFGQNRNVAVTIDDLPVAQPGAGACGFERLESITKELLEPVRREHVPVAAFVGRSAIIRTRIEVSQPRRSPSTRRISCEQSM